MFIWFFVLVLGFFDQLIIIVLCSFDSKQFPEIKKMLFPNFLDVRLQVAVTQSSMFWCKGRWRRSKEMEIDAIYAADYSSNQNFSSVCYHFNDFLLYQKVVSFPFKWSPEQSSSTLSFTYRWLCKCIHCSSMQQEKKVRMEKTVIRGSRVVTTAEEWFWVSLESGLCVSAQPNEILHNHMVRLWATQWQQHLLSQPVFTPSIFCANGPSQSWSLTCNSPLM